MVTTPTLHLGVPTDVGGLTVFPVWTDAPLPRRALPTSLPRGAHVDEVAPDPEVDRLVLRNPTPKSFLLTGGTVLSGGWQHRTLVGSVLVGPERDLDLDVRCVEQGRWHGSARQRLHPRRAPIAVAGALRGIVASRPPDQVTAADQSVVWDRVQALECSLGGSPSASLVEVADHLAADEADVTASIRALPGQRGVLIGVAGHPAVLEVFDHPRVLERQLHGIVLGALADGAVRRAVPTPGRRARAFVARISGRPLPAVRPAGAAVAVGDRDDLVAIEGLAPEVHQVGDAPHPYDDLVHLSALNVRHELVGAA